MKKITEEDIAAIASHYKSILEIIGEDTAREGLLKTPVRAARAFAYATRGYGQITGEVVNGALFANASGSEMVMVRDIEFYSLCEHHILPFFGHATIGYIPDKKIIGLSKLARIVDMFARRLQLQERMTEEIAQTLHDILEPKGVIVHTAGRHLCMSMRGVQKQDSDTVSISSTGIFLTDKSLRAEFFASLR